jgi:hypothetical protein
LKKKSSFIKHDVFKFCGDYEVVLALNENGVCSANAFQKAFELHMSKHLNETSQVLTFNFR